MFEVRKQSTNEILIARDTFAKARQFAEVNNFGEPLAIFEVKQVWTTQTLDEAIDDGVYTGDRRLPR